MIAEEFFLQGCSEEDLEDMLRLQSKLLADFALFCGKLSQYHLKLEEAHVTRLDLGDIKCIRIAGMISGKAEDIAAYMLTTGRIHV